MNDMIKLTMLKIVSGKGIVYHAFAFFCAAGLFILRYRGIEVASLTGPLGVVVGGLYAGGGFKAYSDSKAAK